MSTTLTALQDIEQFFGAHAFTDEAQDTAFDPKRARSFTGDGSSFLFVPGLKSVDFISIDGVPLAEYRDDEVIDEQDPAKKKTIRIPFYVLLSKGGTPVLIRSEISNFGKWQKGSPIVVAGEWEDSPAAEAAPAEDAKAAA